jgi:hypothetical protein
MGSMKSALALIAALIPIAFCGALIYYFFGVGGASVKGVAMVGLGPTVLGLGAIGLMFMVPVIVRLMRLAARPAPGTRPGLAANVPEEEAFDADAALARYMARKAAAGDESQAVVTEPDDAAPAPARPVFGRKAV